MISVPVYEAKTRLSELLLLAQQGQDITITRHGVAAARLVAPLPAAGDGTDALTAQRTSVNDVLDALAALRQGVRLNVPLQQAINAGRD
jgi:prevent-host-death family protein